MLRFGIPLGGEHWPWQLCPHSLDQGHTLGWNGSLSWMAGTGGEAGQPLISGLVLSLVPTCFFFFPDITVSKLSPSHERMASGHLFCSLAMSSLHTRQPQGCLQSKPVPIIL